MADTMEGVVEAGDVELSADEASHIEFLRAKNISAKEVTSKIDAHINRPAVAPPPAAPKPQTVTMPEVRKMFDEYGKEVAQGARASEAQRQIKAAIGKEVDDSGLTTRPKRRDRIVNQIFDSVCDRNDIAKLSDEDFQKVLVDESKKAIDEEREDGGTSPPSSTTAPSSTDEGRKTAAEAMGQTNGNEPPPKSAAQTERPASGNRVNAENMDRSFGAADVNWDLTDAEIEQGTDREAEKFLRKASGG